MKRRSTLLSTITRTPQPGAYTPEQGAESPGRMSPCCAKCKTPFGHSAVAGTCCHTSPKEEQA